MAQSLKDKFQVCWTDETDPSKGFKYIYISSEDYEKLLIKYNGDVSALPVICSPLIGPDGISRHVITDIIGEVLYEEKKTLLSELILNCCLLLAPFHMFLGVKVFK